MRFTVMAGAFVVVVLAGLSTYLAAAQHYDAALTGDYVARRPADWHLTGPDADARRQSMLARAEFRLTPHVDRDSPHESFAGAALPCRFLNDAPSGTTAKFNCVLDDGSVIKVKYGRNPEIQAEVAGTRLLQMLGFPADDEEMVPRLRCYGCPRDPFVTVVAGTWTYTRSLLGPAGFDRGYTDFDWVAIEHRFAAPAIETDSSKGWAWWELRHAAAHHDDRDALQLLAVFLAHWDNKAENQRLVCLDAGAIDGNEDCQRPLAMIQDLGATFGPTKVNIGRWASLPIWSDRASCRVSMRTLPWRGGTFPDTDISEQGRRLIADGLRALTDDQIRGLFLTARFPEFQTATDDGRDLEQWVDAFRSREWQIDNAGPCPE